MKIRLFGITALCALTFPTLAIAGPPDEGEAELTASASLSTDGEANVEGSASTGEKDRGDQPWIKRWAPEPGMAEIGIYGGVLLPTPNHELFEADAALPDQGFKPLRTLAPDLGLRVGYYPLRFFGIEAEGGVMPTGLKDGSGNALLYTIRGHLVGQLGLWSVTPFVLVGAGGLGVSSPREVLGNDIDPALHFGGGVKIYINRRVMLRLDVRDVVNYKRGLENVFIAHNLEALLGLSITLGRKKAEPKPAPQPKPPSDRDGDGLIDEQDSCPDQAETVNGYQDDDGCPESDRDGDGFWDDQDGCPDEPETENGYQDDDGCPDEVPKEVQDFTGTIKGITFDNDADTIRKSSAPTLDKAVEVLKNNPNIRIRISGHTDSKGDHDHNLDLSRRRAASVKRYLVEHGIDEGRIETDGHGPDKPIDTNDTKAGRANNRRIEFEIIRRAR